MRGGIVHGGGVVQATRTLLLAGLLGALAGCAAPLVRAPLELPAALATLQSKQLDGVTVSAAILTDAQARAHFGADLAAREVQVAWLGVRNASGRRLWFIPNLLDADFYSADEVALMVQGDVPAGAFDALRQHLRDEAMRVLLPPGTLTEGMVFLPRVEGGRFLDVSLHADSWDDEAARGLAGAAAPARTGSRPRELRFGFAVALPDGDFDYERIDPARAYGERTLPDLDAVRLRAELEKLPCCTTDAEGRSDGDPLNVVIVGEGVDVLNALSRAGWSFTHRISARTVAREVGAAVTGAAYPVAPVSNLYVFGRPHDVALQRARHSIAQRNHMRLWLAPFRFEGRPVWIGQVSRDIGVKLTTKSPTLTTHVIDPAVDTTREYLLHSLLAQRLVDRFGFVRGSALAPRDRPRVNLTDDPYFSDGMRLVLLITREPVPVHEIRNLMWERSAPPVAAGQSEAATRNTRPIGASGQ